MRFFTIISTVFYQVQENNHRRFKSIPDDAVGSAVGANDSALLSAFGGKVEGYDVGIDELSA